MELLTVAEVAKEIKRSTGRVRELIREGKLTATQLKSGEYVITRENLDTFKATPRKWGRPSKAVPTPPKDVKVNPLSQLAIKEKRRPKEQGKGKEGELSF